MENILRHKIKKFGDKLSRKMLDLECETLMGDFNSDIKNRKREIELAMIDSIFEDYKDYFNCDSFED